MLVIGLWVNPDSYRFMGLNISKKFVNFPRFHPEEKDDPLDFLLIVEWFEFGCKTQLVLSFLLGE